jgi:hypothetical protein
LVIFNGRMDSGKFIIMCENSLLPFLNNTFPDGHRLVMDNDSKHVSKETKKWMEENEINHWPTPAQSPVIKLFFIYL